MAACTVSREPAFAFVVQDCLSHDGTRRVARAEEQDVIAIGHLLIPLLPPPRVCGSLVRSAAVLLPDLFPNADRRLHARTSSHTLKRMYLVPDISVKAYIIVL